MDREKYMQEMMAAYEAMDDRAREQQLRLAKRAAADWPRPKSGAPSGASHGESSPARP
jgi:hypothetical protein